MLVDRGMKKLEKIIEERLDSIDIPQGESFRYFRRVNWELEAIQKNGQANELLSYVELFDRIGLFLNDMIIARGTYTSSFIAYLIGISNVNPIKYNLYPEFAFGNKGDKKLDIDFAYPAKLQPKFEEMNTYNIQKARPSKYLDFVYRCLAYDPDITFEESIFSNEKYLNYFAPYYLGVSDLVYFFPIKTQDDLVKIALLKSAHGMLEAMHKEVGPDLELIDINQLILSREDLYDFCLNAGFTEDEGYKYVYRKMHSKDDLTEFENRLATSEWTLNQDVIFQQQLKYAFSSRYMFPKGHWISLTQACIKYTSLIFENCIGME